MRVVPRLIIRTRGVIERRENSAFDVVRNVHWLGLTVVRARSREDDESIEERSNLFHLLFIVPELEVSAVFLFPVRGEIQQRIDSTMKLELEMPVEILVNVQEVTVFANHRATTKEIWIGEETFDSGNSLEKEDELARSESR